MRRHRTRTSDYIMTVLGVVMVIIAGKLKQPDASIIDILKFIVKSQVGWWW